MNHNHFRYFPLSAMLLTLTLSLGLYLFFAGKKKEVVGQLTRQLKELEMSHELALQTRQDLISRIRSQDDPKWIEMILMQKLGLVPEGKTKVFFEKNQ